MALFLILLYGLIVPYVGLMMLVVAGMLRRPESPRSPRRPSLSVIIPAHNEEEKLPATLGSLARQRYPGPVEFIVVDDRSSDRTSEIAAAFAREDSRFRCLRVDEPSRRLSPKVNAVNEGIRGSSGEIIVTSDADCEYPEGWLEGLAEHFTDGVVMVVGYVETTRAGRWTSMLQAFESIDWLSLMLVSRSLTRFGWKFASSANNQAYRRSAFEAIGGFGAGGRAPSGDEDLLTQRMGRLPDSRIVFASSPATRVFTHPMPSLGALLRQRRRWVSRYHHVMHYHPAFIASIALLGLSSIMMSVAVPAALFVPALAPWVFGLWSVELAIMLGGMWLGMDQLGRRDLWGLPTLVWAVLHPPFIATVVLWSLASPGEWWAGAQRYRRRYWKRLLRELGRRLRSRLFRY